MYKLKCVPQNYDWGKKGSKSLVAKIVEANGILYSLIFRPNYRRK